MESLFFEGVAAVLGEGLELAAAAAAAAEASHRDLRWWEVAELGGLGALPPGMPTKTVFLLPIERFYDLHIKISFL